MVDGYKEVSESSDRSKIQHNPYGPNPGDFLSNVGNFQLIESTFERR